VGAGREPAAQFVMRHVEQHEAHRGCNAVAQPVAIGAAQRRAGRDDIASGKRGVHRRRDPVEPRPAIGIAQRRAGAHPGDVRRAVEIVPLDEPCAARCRE